MELKKIQMNDGINRDAAHRIKAEWMWLKIMLEILHDKGCQIRL